MLNPCDLRVAAPVDAPWRPSDSLSARERAAVLRENARRGLLHLVVERTEEEKRNGNAGRARVTDGRSQLVTTGKHT